MNKERIIEWSTISVGVVIMVMGFSFFLEPLGIVTGGFMGTLVLIDPLIENTFLTQSLLLLVMNVVVLIIGGWLLGKQFFIRTIYATLLTPLIVYLFELINKPRFFIDLVEPSSQYLVAAILGGALIGVGIGVLIRNNTTSGGMDVVQRIINKLGKIPFSVAVYLTDGLVVVAGIIIGMTRGDITSGLYGMLSMVIASLIIERTAVFGRTSYTALIITNKTAEIKDAIYSEIDRGITKIKVLGGYSNEEKEMIMCTLYRNQLHILKDSVKKIDPLSFMLVLHTKEVVGDGFRGDDIT